MKTFYMPKGYMKVKLIYFKKSLEGYPYSSTITIIHRSQITRKYRKWKTKKISGYHKVCKGRPITKKKPCNKAKVAKYYIVTVTKGKKTKKLYTKRIPYSHLTPKKSFVITSKVTRKCKKKNCVHRFKVCRVKKMNQCYFVSSKPFPVALGYKGSAKNVTTYMVKFKAVYMAKKYDTNVYIIKGKIKKKGKKYYFTLCKTNGKGCVKWVTVYYPPKYKKVAIKKPKLKKSLEGFYYSAGVHIYKPFVMSAKYPLAKYTIKGKITLKTICTIKKLPTKKSRCAKKSRVKYYKLKMCKKPANKKCTIVYVKRVPYSHHSKKWLIAGKVTKKCKISKKKKCSCRYLYKGCAGKSKYCALAVKKTFPKLKYRGSAKSINTVMVMNKKSYLKKKYSVKAYTVTGWVRYSRAKVCTARGKHSNKVTKKVYSFKICKAKGKVCKTIITYFSPLGLYGITKKIVISKKLKRWTKGKLLWTSHVTIIKPLKVSKKYPNKTWKLNGKKKQVTLCKGKATTKTKACAKAAKKKYYKLTFVMSKKTWISKVIYTKRISLYYLSPNKLWTVAGGVTEKCKKCKCVYKWKSCHAKSKKYCVLAIAAAFPGALAYSGSKKKVNTLMIKNHIRYLMILKSTKKYKYKSMKGKKGKCYTKYTVVICSGKKYSKCKEVYTKYKVNKKYKLYVKPKVVKWVLTKKLKKKCIGQIKKKLFVPCKLDKKWFVVGCGTQVKKCYNKTCGDKKGKTQIQVCNKKMWAYTVCPRPKQYFPVLPWQKCSKKKKSKKLQKREVTTPNVFDGAFPDWMMPGGGEHPAFTDVVEESSLALAKRAAKKKTAKDTKVVHYKSKTVKFILPDKTHKMKCRQYYSWTMPKCLHKPNLKLVFSKAFVKYYKTAQKKYPSVCKKYKGYFLKGSIANEDKCWKKKYGNYNFGKCHKLSTFKVCKVIEKKDSVTTKCVSATTWNKPKCFKKLNLKPLYKKKFTTWVTSKIKPLKTKCATWKKGGYTINGNVKNKEKCWNKSYSGSKFKKCVTTYRYRLCKEVKVKGKSAMKCKRLTTSTKLSCLKKTDITAFHKKNFVIYLKAKYPTKCKKYKKYKLKGSIKSKNKCWKKDQLGNTVNYCSKMYHYKLCKFTDKGKDVLMKCTVLTSFTKPKCYNKAKMKPYYQKKFNIVITKVAKKYPTKCKKYDGYFLTNAGIKSIKKCYTKTYEKKYKYKKCHKLATYTVCKPKGTSTKVTFTCVKLVSWNQPKCFKTLTTKPLWNKVFLNYIKTKVMTKYGWKTAYCPKDYYVYKSIKRSKKCWTKAYWGKVDTKVTFQKCHKLYKYKICKTVATKSGIPKVSCKSYTTWTKPKCKQIKKKLTFWKSKFALYIKKKIRPQYALDCAKYKGRLLIKQSLKRKRKCFTKTYGNNTGKLCHNMYKFKLCIKPSLSKEMPDDCAKRVTWSAPKCWPEFDLENHWKAIFLAYLAKDVVPKYKLPCVQYKKYFVYGEIKYVKKCWQKKIGTGTLQKCHKLHKYAVCKIITKGDGSKALKCKDLLTWKYPRCFRRVRIKLVFWKSKWEVFIRKKIIPVNSFDQSTYGSWIVLGDVTYTEKCFTKKYGKVTAKKCHQMAVFKACKKLHLDKPKNNKCKNFTVWTYPKKLKHISEAEYYTSVYAYYIKHTELPKLKVPCKAKKGYLRKAYAQSTVCCSKCCSTFNSKKHTMVLKSRKCYEGKRGGFMFNYCTDTYKTNICNSKDIKSCVEIETLKKPTCFKDYNPKDLKWEAAIVAAGVKYYKKNHPDACDLGEYYGYSLIGSKIKTKKKCKKFTVNGKSKKYCHTLHSYKICKQQVQGGFNCAKITAYTGPQCFYILEKSYYYKEDFSFYIQEQRGKHPIPQSKGKWFINKEISRMEKCWDKTYGGKKKKYCHRLYSYKICYYKSNKKLVCKAWKSWEYPTGLEHNKYMSTSIKYGWYFYKIGLFRYDPKVWFVYGVITKVNIDVNEYAAWIKSWNQEFAYHQHRSDINSFYSASESEETVNVYEFQLCRTFKTGLSTTKIYCKHKVSRYPIDNLNFKIKAKPKGAAVIKYGAWKVVQSSVGKKCYQTHWKKKLYNLCVKAKTVKKCRKVTKGTSTKKTCFLVETRISETYKAVKVPNGNFDSAVPDNDHNGKVPKKWKSFNGLRVDTLSADLKLQGSDMISNSNNGGTFVRLNSNNIIIKEIGTQVTGFRKGYMYVAVFEQALMYNWGHCEGHFRVQLGKQVHFSPMMRLPSKYPSMTKWQTVKIGYYIGTSPDLNLKISAVRGHHCHNPRGGAPRTFTDLLIDAIYFECIGPLPPDGAPGLGHPALFNVQGYQGYRSRVLPKVYPSGSGKITRGGYSKRVIRGSSSGGYMQIIYETNHGKSVHTVPLSHGIRRVKSKKK